MRRKRSLFCGSNIFPQMLRIECTYNGGMYTRMRQRKAQKEGSAALAWLAQFIQARFLKLLPSIYVPQPNASLASRDTAADDGTDARLGRTADQILMIPLQSGIRNLEGIEYAPFEINRQVRRGSGNADESHFPLLLHLFESVHQLIFLCFFYGGIVQLHNVDIVGFHALETFL